MRLLIHTNIMELGTGYTNKGRHNFIILTIYPLRKPSVGRYVVFVRLPCKEEKEKAVKMVYLASAHYIRAPSSKN